MPTDAAADRFSSVWKQTQDAARPPVLVADADALRRQLGIPPDWRGASHLKLLLTLLQSQHLGTPIVYSTILRIERDHGRDALEQIGQELTRYFATSPRPGAVEKSILWDALHDVGYPSNIRQRNKKSCAATAVQMKLAIEQPAEYVRILTTLARGSGYRLPGGEVLQPNNSWKLDLFDSRSYSARIMQNALMALGKASTANYNSEQNPEGLNYLEKVHVLKQVFGNASYTHDMVGTGEQLYQLVEDEIARGRPVTVSFKGHCVLVVGIDKTQSPARVIMDSWGQQYSMTVYQFASLVKDVASVDDPGLDNKQTAARSRVILGDRLSP